jgi:hypothetical protein
MRALMVEYFGGSPLQKYGIRPQRTLTMRRLLSSDRTTSTGWVG